MIGLLTIPCLLWARERQDVETAAQLIVFKTKIAFFRALQQHVAAPLGQSARLPVRTDAGIKRGPAFQLSIKG
jgi:hypothetical protein